MKKCLLSEAEEALLINFAVACKYMSLFFRLCAWFHFQQKNHTPWKTQLILRIKDTKVMKCIATQPRPAMLHF